MERSVKGDSSFEPPVEILMDVSGSRVNSYAKTDKQKWLFCFFCLLNIKEFQMQGIIPGHYSIRFQNILIKFNAELKTDFTL